MVGHRVILPVWIYWRQDWWQLEYKMADPYLLCFWQNSESLFGLRTCLWWYWCLCAGWTQKDKMQELSCSCFENSSLFSIMVLAMDSRVLLNCETTYEASQIFTKGVWQYRRWTNSSKVKNGLLINIEYYWKSIWMQRLTDSYG